MNAVVSERYFDSLDTSLRQAKYTFAEELRYEIKLICSYVTFLHFNGNISNVCWFLISRR